MAKKKVNSDYNSVIKEKSTELYNELMWQKYKWEKVNKGFWVWVEGTLMPTKHANKIDRHKAYIDGVIDSSVNEFYKAVEKSVYACLDTPVTLGKATKQQTKASSKAKKVTATNDIEEKKQDINENATELSNHNQPKSSKGIGLTVANTEAFYNLQIEGKNTPNNIEHESTNVNLSKCGKKEFTKEEYSQRFKNFLRDAESGNSESQFYVAVCYQNGFGTRKLNQKALEWYEKSANQGDADANYHLGVVYESGLLGVRKELPKAFEYYKKASNQGHPMAKRSVGIYYLDGIKSYLRRTSKNIAQGIELLSELSANGDCEATKRLVKHYRCSENEYLKWLRIAAEQGDADSQYWLALACKQNNIDESIEWYKKAAQQNHFCAAHHLGVLYEKRKDYDNAIHWYNVDIEIGESTCYASYCHLSWIYEHGLGVIRDVQAAALCRAKAEEKNAHSSANEFAEIREYYTNHERVMRFVNNVPHIKGSSRNIAKCAMLAIALGEISVVWIRVHLDIEYDEANSILVQLERLGYISQLDIYVKPFPIHKTLVSVDRFYRDLNNGVIGEIEI